jgi:autotransporter-associated beta strand protein
MKITGYKAATIIWLAVLLGAGETSRAQTSWAAAASGNWNTASSWTPAIVPGEGTNASITNAGTFTVTYNSVMSAGSIGSLTLGSATSIPTLTIAAGGFNVAGSCTFVDSSAEIININSGGVMTNGTLNMASRAGVVNVNSGGVMTNGTTQVSNNGSNDGAVTLKVNSGATANLGTVTVGRNSESASDGLQIAGGTVSASSIAVGTKNSYATMAVSGGTLTNAGSLQMGTGSATATREVRYYQTGGTVGCAGTVDLAVATNYTIWFSVLGSSSTFSAAGIRIFPNAPAGAVVRFTNSGSIYLGASGFNVLNTGTNTVALNDQSLLGATADWSGNVNMVTGNGTVTFKAADAAGTAHNITLTNPISGSASLVKTGGGTLTLYGANTYSGNTTVSVGLLMLGNSSALPATTALTVGGSSTTGIVDLAGFNLQISGLATAGTAANQLITNSSPASTSTLTFSNSAANSTFGGVIAGGSNPITLTLLGGNLTLSGQNTYAGNIFIGNGQLALSGAGSTFNGPAIVLSNSTAILDVSGMGGLALSAGQSLSGSGIVTGNVAAANCLISPGTGGVAGTLTFSNGLTLNGGTTSHFDLAPDPNAAGNDLIVVGGALNLSGINTIEVTPLGTSLSAGTYKLIQFGVLGSGGAANFQVTGTLGASLESIIDVTAKEMDLIVSPASGTQRTWKGDGLANNWDYTTANWLNGSAADVFSDGNLVTFDDTGSTTPPVNLTTTLQPATVLVNAAANYTFGGSGKISGTGTLTKTNSGTLIILTPNDYSGGTTIGQGILQLGNGTTSGSSGSGAIQNSGTLVLNLPGSNIFTNLVSGTGNLVQAGSGTLTLTASNSYSGGTAISNGTLQINTGAWFGSGNVTNNGLLVFNSSGNSTVDAAISGTGMVLLANSGTVTLTGNNTYSGGTTVSAGTLLVNNSTGSGVGTGAVVVAGGGTLGGGGVIGGPVTINSGGIFAPGNPVGTLTVSNNFTAGSGAILNYTLGTSSDRTVVSGNLNLSGTLNITAGAGFTSATYTLFTYSGTLTLGSLAVTLPANTISTIDTNTPGRVNLIVGTLQSDIPAFPGALGFGANATGARFGGTVYHVTNLADSGTGSFRDAVSQPNRFIVFDVGGYIVLNSAVSCANNLTIAGQTAPGDGIGIMGHEVSFSVKTNVIVRCLRIRPGSLAASTEDGINVGDGTNMIFDHISIEFAPYNNVDAVGSLGNSHLITIQNSILADPIGQQFNAHTEAVGNDFSWCYNILSSAHNRNPLAKINTIFINNVVYNFQGGYTVASTSGHFTHDIINNYFIAGPSTTSPGDDFFQMDSNQQIYSSGNLLDGDNNGSLGGSSTAPGGVVVLTSPWSALTPNIPTFSTVAAYRYDVSLSGAFPHDQVDQDVISDVTSLGTSGQMWTTQTATGLGNNGYGVINGATAPLDTDQDGLPDYWEQALGSNPNVADSLTPGTGGYTKLENYLNWLAGPHAVAPKNSFVDVDLRQYTGGFTNASPVYSTFAPTNGAVALQADGHTARFTPAGNFSGLGSFNFSVRAGDGSAMTNTVGVLMTATGLSRNLTWRGDGVTNNWDSQSTNWLNGTNPVTFNPGDTVTFDDTGSNSPVINLVGALQPAAITVAANQNYAFSGSGSLGGVMSLVKSGACILTIGTSNTFTGGVTVSAGTLQVNNPGGSATGPSQVFVASGATLSGNGVIGGLTALDDGAMLAPGNGAGTLTINNELDLSDLTVLQFGLGTNSNNVVVGGNLFASGIINISDSGGFGPGSYTLFIYDPANTLSLGNLTFGAVPAGFNYRLDTNTPGQVTLIVALPASPQFGNISLIDGNFVLTGTGGSANGTYFVLTSTNLALPLSNWTRLFTNEFDGDGNFNFTNVPDPNAPQVFYLLQLP